MTATVGKPLTLTAIVTDDGVPRPRGSGGGRGRSGEGVEVRPPSRITVGKSLGLHLSWFVYRGPGASVAFEPRQIKTWEDLRVGAKENLRRSSSGSARIWALPARAQSGVGS